MPIDGTTGVYISPEKHWEPDSFEIAYRPNIEVSKFYEQFSKWLPIFFLSVIAAFLIVMTCGLDKAFLAVLKFFIAPIKPYLLAQRGVSGINFEAIEMITWPITWAFGLFIAFMTLKEGFKPTNIRITSDGMEVFRRENKTRDGYTTVLAVEHRAQAVDWAQVGSARLRRKSGKRSHHDYEIVFAHSKGEFAVRYGDIENPFERMSFINALERHLKPEQLDPQIKQVFSDKGERESYTELWLRELNAPPKRDKLVPLSIGCKLHNNEYVIRDKIGVGGQAAVYLAESTKLAAGQNMVAIKEFILPVFPDPRVRLAAAERFQTEAEIISRVKHPQIVRFLDLFIEDHRAYLVLERISGRNLKQLVENEGPLAEDRVIALAVQMCDILSFLHGLEPPIAHRDFTPDNLMLSGEGQLKLIDFSVAQAAVSNVTGSVVGKPEFIAPEQFRGKPTPLSDLYSLGGTLSFLLTGENPEAISVSRPANASAAFADIVARATALDPAARFQSAEELKQALLSLGTADGVMLKVETEEKDLVDRR